MVANLVATNIDLYCRINRPGRPDGLGHGTAILMVLLWFVVRQKLALT